MNLVWRTCGGAFVEHPPTKLMAQGSNPGIGGQQKFAGAADLVWTDTFRYLITIPIKIYPLSNPQVLLQSQRKGNVQVP